VAENWTKWEKEKPDWFTPAFISCVPDDFIPDEQLQVLHEENEAMLRNKDRRRSGNLIEAGIALLNIPQD